MTDEILMQVEKGVATITLNRPQARNALTDTMQDALLEAVRRAAEDPRVKAVMLTGAGKAFCAGGDVKGITARAANDAGANTPERRAEVLRGRMEISRLLHEMPKPTLAAVNGAAAGAGFSIALACDLRIAAEEARFITAFSKVGLTGDYGGTYFATKLMGAARVRDLYFRSEPLNAQDALQLGIVNRCVPGAHFATVARAYARSLARLPTATVGVMKKTLNLAQTGTLSQVLDAESINMIFSSATAEHKSLVEAARRQEK
jgi:2-(1,2-epoxy-1,2-dihydrophenyl)acetyl-CoA isomerase